MFTLTKRDKELLTKWGHPKSDFEQIEEAANICEYENTTHRKIKHTTAIRTLGKVEFLSGISRAAFHWTACRAKGEKRVYFDCSSMFK